MQNYENLWGSVYQQLRNRSCQTSLPAALTHRLSSQRARQCSISQGNWEWSALAEKGMSADDLTMIPYYCGVEGEEKARFLNCGTENCWAVNAEASEEDIQATLDFNVCDGHRR